MQINNATELGALIRKRRKSHELTIEDLLNAHPVQPSPSQRAGVRKARRQHRHHPAGTCHAGTGNRHQRQRGALIMKNLVVLITRRAVRRVSVPTAWNT